MNSSREKVCIAKNSDITKTFRQQCCFCPERAMDTSPAASSSSSAALGYDPKTMVCPEGQRCDAFFDGNRRPSQVSRANEITFLGRKTQRMKCKTIEQKQTKITKEYPSQTAHFRLRSLRLLLFKIPFPHFLFSGTRWLRKLVVLLRNAS